MRKQKDILRLIKKGMAVMRGQDSGVKSLDRESFGWGAKVSTLRWFILRGGLFLDHSAVGT